MEEIVQKLLLLAFLLALIVLTRRRERRLDARQRAVARGLVVPASPLIVACLARSTRAVPCADCKLRQQCWVTSGAPATEEKDRRGAGRYREQDDLAFDFDRVGRSLSATEGVLERLIELVALLPTLGLRSIGALIRSLLSSFVR